MPSAPVDLTYISINSTSILVSWSPPLFSNGIIINYIVVVTEVEIDMELTLNATDTQVLITDLKPHTKYSVVVFAETSAGVGESSLSLAILTDEEGMFI